WRCMRASYMQELGVHDGHALTGAELDLEVAKVSGVSTKRVRFGLVIMAIQLVLCRGCGLLDPDSDGDEIIDDLDNCPARFNEDQTDTDGDGVGDVCEVVDLAMGDAVAGRVYVYLDVLTARSAGTQPDAILDNAGSGISAPNTVSLEDGWLAVGNTGNDTVTLYGDLTGLTDGAAPTVTLDNGGSGIDDPRDLQMVAGDLYVACEDDSTVRIYRDVSTLTHGVAANAVLDAGGSDVSGPVGLCVAGGVLYVANAGNDTITVYENADGLTGAPAPSATLNAAGSQIDNPIGVSVINNVLYVCNLSAGVATNTVTAYSPADGLTDGQAPDFVLGGPSGLVQPYSVAGDTRRIFASNLGVGLGFGIVGFSGPASLVSGNPPTLTLGSVVQLEGCPEAVTLLGSMWTISQSFPGIYGYRYAASVGTDDAADVTLYDATMSAPSCLAIEER
ncbi:MAG: hypothetical protein JSU68_06905, partial [Phycisphaerales bacterium]